MESFVAKKDILDLIKYEDEEIAKKAIEEGSKDVTYLNEKVLPSTDPHTLPERTSHAGEEADLLA